MKKILLFFGVAVLVHCNLGETVEELYGGPAVRVKIAFGQPESDIGKTYLLPVPLTQDSAVNENDWIFDGTSNYYGSLSRYRPRDDPSVCGLYDDNGNICGLEIAIEKINYHEAVLDWTIQGYESREIEVDGEIKEYWYKSLWFVSEEYQNMCQEDRLALYDNSVILQEGDLWVSGLYNEIFRVPGTYPEIMDAGFTEHNCIKMMGTHYYLNMTEETECTSEGLFSWAPMMVNQQLSGVVLNTVGKYKVSNTTTDHFEHPAAAMVASIMRVAPDCLLAAAANPGLTTMHVYFIDKPNLITCPSS